MRTRLFLRTSEFLWQEGHTAHSTEAEAIRETERVLDVYADFAESFMAVPVVKGRKSAGERFPGAVETYCIEAMMQDGKSLQAGTSHFLGQNFAKAFDVKFASKKGKLDTLGYIMGRDTRLMGALVMAHSDDEGLVLPPKLAPIHVVIVPIFRNEDELNKVTAAIDPIIKSLRQLGYAVKFDNRDTHKPGFQVCGMGAKRCACTPCDWTSRPGEWHRGSCTPGYESKGNPEPAGHCQEIPKLLDAIQENMFQKALAFRNSMITEVNSYAELACA